MRGWILTTPNTLSKLPLSAERAEAMGLKIVDINDIDIVINREQDGTIGLAGERVALPDFALSAFVQPKSYRPTAALRQLESLGVLCINSSRSISISRDKIYTSQVLSAASIPVANTIYLEKRRINYEQIEKMFGYPLVIKILDGTQGQGVYLASSREDVARVCEEVEAEDILIQEYIASSFGRDIRVTSFAGEVLKVVSRQSKGEDFRSNVSLGGTATEIEPDDKMVDLAKRIYQATGIDLCGIDLLLSEDGYIVCELNSMPGGLEPSPISNPMQKIVKGIAKMVSQKAMPQWRVDHLLREARETPLHKVISSLGAMDRYKSISTLTDHSQRVQESVLSSIIAASRDSKYGKEHSFEQITDIKSFQRQPITEWSNYEPYVDMMVEGSSDILFHGKTDSFVTTSGTTAKPKLIPESSNGKSSKGFVSINRFDAIVAKMPSLITKGAILPIVLTSSSDTTASGIKCAYASGMAIGQLPQQLQDRIAFPAEILTIKDTKLYSYLVMRYAIERDDMAVIAGNNAIRMVKLVEIGDQYRDMIISDIERGDISFIVDSENQAVVEQLKARLKPNAERAAYLKDIISRGDKFAPLTYWPDLKVATFWTSSSVGLSMPDLLPLLPSGIKIMDTGYGASELKVNIPIEFGSSDGLLSTATAFYEFMPLDSESSETLLAHELEVGGEYEIIVTTYAGLYRYNIKDVVKCTGFMGSTPRVVFVRKSGDIANIAGEKLPATAIINAISDLAQSTGVEVIRVQAMANYADKNYHLYIEAASTKDREIFASEIDSAICGHHWSYSEHIKKGTITPVKVTFMKQGWQDELYRAKRGGRDISESQIKLPIFIEEAPEQQWYE